MSRSLVARYLALGIAVLLGSYLLVTSTMTLSDTLWKYDVKRILQVFIFPLIFAIVLFNPTLRVGFLAQFEKIPRWLLTTLGLLFGLGALSSVVNNSTTMAVVYSLSDVSMLILCVLGALCVAACRMVVGTVFDQVVVLLIALLVAAVGLQELMGVLAALELGIGFHPRVALMHFSWPRFYNQLQSWGMPVITALPLVFPGKVSAKILCLVALTLGWYVIIATGGRGSMVGLAAAMTLGFILLPAARKILVRHQLTGLIGGLLVYALVILGHKTLVDEFRTDFIDPSNSSVTANLTQPNATDYSEKKAELHDEQQYTGPMTGPRLWSSSGRTYLWQASLHDAQSHPWLGNGPMNYACTGPLYREASPHNFFMQILGEWGIPAFLLLLLVVGFLFLRLLWILRKPEDTSSPILPTTNFMAMGVVAAMVHACLSGVLEMPASQVAGVLIAGTLLGQLPTNQFVKPARSKGVGVLVLSLILSIAFTIFALRELAVSEIRFEQTQSIDRGIPRLWQNGKVCRLYQK